MLVQGPILQGEGSTVPVESHHIPSSAPTNSQPPLSSPLRTTLRQETKVPRPSSPSQTHDADEVASIRVDVRLRGAATTVSSLDAGQGSGNIDKTPSMPHDSPLPSGHTPGSDEGRMQQNELMDLVTKLSNKVLVLETNLKETKKVYSTAFTKLISKVKKLEKIVKSNKARRRAKFIVSDDEEVFEDSSKQGRRIADIDQDFDVFLVHHDAGIQGRYEDISTAEFNISIAKPVSTAGVAVTTASVSTAEPSAPSTTTIKTYTRTTRGVTIREPSTRQRLSPQQQIDPKNKGKGKMVESEKPSKKNDQVKADEELAKRLEEDMQAELEEEARTERIAQEEAYIAALTAEFDVVQARMDVDALLAAKLQEDEREKFSINEQARFLVETIAKRKRFFVAQRPEQIRNKPPTRAQLRNKMVTYLKHMVVGSSVEKGVGSRKKTLTRKRTVPGDEIVMEVESLSTKADGSSKNYKIFSEMLDDFDRQDVMDLHRLVQERYDTTSPEGYDLLLWGDLKILFEPNEEDEIWKNQQDYNLISWRLFDLCGVHVLLMNT
ncbi:hypothetical protein Tco_1003696 [Tanacetum coccineum]|uniref:Uncharacterized protein n=1 Tax=Tanacetum coccineum TaxID=301880 RepID=A0ABQ5F9U7_9ASTR